MKKFTSWLLCILMLAVPFASVIAEDAAEGTHILVVYFSRTGENYGVGEKKAGSPSASYAGYITQGNTAILASLIAETAHADLFEITPLVPYPEDYASTLQIAREEITADARPEISAVVENLADYDIVFIGYPIWHGKLPQVIYTFIDQHDLSGKTVIPFNTHEGSGQSGTQQALEKALPGSTVLQGLAVQGRVAQEEPERAEQLVGSWLTGLSILDIE